MNIAADVDNVRDQAVPAFRDEELAGPSVGLSICRLIRCGTIDSS